VLHDRRRRTVRVEGRAELRAPRLAALPLEYQPGTAWKYSALSGIDTLGRIVEVASGQTFDQFLKQRVFDPLGMKDTSFYPDEARTGRSARISGWIPRSRWLAFS
jgi:CubicO group peptidase (beta-lactamase class C family)